MSKAPSKLPKIGRPAGDKPGPRGEFLQVRVTPAIRKLLAAAHRTQGGQLSDVVRSALERGLRP